MSRAGLFLSRHGIDLLIVVAAVQAAVATSLKDDLSRASGPWLWLEACAIGATVLLLLGRRRFPFAAPAGMWLASAALSFLDGRLIVNQAGIFVAGMGAAVLLGNQRTARQAHLGLLIVVAGSVVVVLNEPGATGDSVVSVPVLFAIGWMVGYALRERTAAAEAAEARAHRAERERESAARLAVAEERSRIARELHDVVAHAVSVIVLQVGAVRHRMPESAVEDREALQNVEEAGRTALTEMRRLLDAMREEGDVAELRPHPGLGDLGRLVDDVRAAGLAVQVDVRGDPTPLPRGLDLSAYRVLQEGLTNSLKHAAGDVAHVSVDYRPDELRLEVRSHGSNAAVWSDGLGHGLVGIRERVKIFGGDMSAGPAPGGGFLLRTRFPLQGGPS